MIIYNKEWIDNLRIQDIAVKWFGRGLISQPQLNSIQQQFVSGYKLTNLFVRIGLFLFTFILATSAIGLVMLFMSSAIQNIGFALIIFAGITWFVLEKFIKDRKYFKNGIDDMLLYIALGYFISGISILFFEVMNTVSWNTVLLIAAVVFPVLVFFAIRFADAIISLMAYLCLLVIIFILVHKTGAAGKPVMPFAMMLISFLAFRLASKSRKEEQKIYWRNCQNAVKTISLFTLYAAGNYFVVRESFVLLFDLYVQPGQDIPLAFIFYLLTLSIPIAYIIVGIRSKDRILLRLGVILSALAILTYRYYYHFVNTEFAMIIAGIILIAFSGFVIRQLKTPWNGFTFKDADDERSFEEAESLLVAQTFSQQENKSNDIGFGGGSFGGGGAGGSF